MMNDEYSESFVLLIIHHSALLIRHSALIIQVPDGIAGVIVTFLLPARRWLRPTA